MNKFILYFISVCLEKIYYHIFCKLNHVEIQGKNKIENDFFNPLLNSDALGFPS